MVVATAQHNGALFKIVEDEVDGFRRFVGIHPVQSEELAVQLAPRIRRVYFDRAAQERKLRDGINDLNMFSAREFTVTETEVEQALEEELDAVLPAEWRGGRPRQTDVQRSELAEIIAAEVFRGIFSTTLPAMRISGKEIPDQQTRGIDLLGFEDTGGDTVTVILGEVKGSCERRSPPQVVADMAHKLRVLVEDRRTLLQELGWLRDHSDAEHVALCNRTYAGYLLNKVVPNFVLAPILLRTTGTAGEKDAGVFRSPDFPAAHEVRFVRVSIMAEDLFKFAVEVYRMARHLEET